MKNHTSLSWAGKLTVAGLLTGAYRDRHSRAGGYIPRNAVIGVLALPFLAVLVVLGIRVRWMPAVTVPFAALGVVGAFVGPLGLADRLAGTLGLTILAATVLQLLGLTTAVIAGIVATVQNYRGQSPAAGR
jgi:hypothetical protein